MYCAITPSTKIVMEKQSKTAAIMLPKPANGTPNAIHRVVITVSDEIEIIEDKTPNIETQASGNVL